MHKPTHGDVQTRRFLLFGALAGPLFCSAWFIEGLYRDGYDPMRHPLSALSFGESGWTQISSFIVNGMLIIGLAFGLGRTLRSGRVRSRITILISSVGIGFIGTGVFATDPTNGYPRGTPALLMPPTLVGSFHLLFSSLTIGFPAACFVLARHFDARGEDHWAFYSRSTAVTFIIVYLSAIAGFLQLPGLVNYAGLLQRTSIVIGLTWLTLLPLHLYRQ